MRPHPHHGGAHLLQPGVPRGPALPVLRDRLPVRASPNSPPPAQRSSIGMFAPRGRYRSYCCCSSSSFCWWAAPCPRTRTPQKGTKVTGAVQAMTYSPPFFLPRLLHRAAPQVQHSVLRGDAREEVHADCARPQGGNRAARDAHQHPQHRRVRSAPSFYPLACGARGHRCYHLL